jgi:hypothetical protein
MKSPISSSDLAAVTVQTIVEPPGEPLSDVLVRQQTSFALVGQ